MESDYLIFITLGCLMILSPLVKSYLKRAGIPEMVGYICLGFIVSLINAKWNFITTAFDNTFSAMAQLGIVALLFRVGLKSHTKALLDKLPDASPIWAGDVLINFALGFIVSYYAVYLTLEASLVIATALSATSVAISVSIWDELNILDSPKGRLLVDVAELDDLSGVLILAVLLATIPALQNNQINILVLAGSITLITLMKLILFITGCYLFAHYLEADFTKFSRNIENSNTAVSITILGAGLTIAALAGYLGFSLAIGALFAGLAFSRDPQTIHTRAKFTDFYEFFSPFFFIYIGMQLNPEAVIGSIGTGLLLFMIAVIGKIIGVGLPAMKSLPKDDALLLGVSMVPRAEIALVIIHQFHELDTDIISEEVFAGLVFVSIVTSITAPLMLRWIIQRKTT